MIKASSSQEADARIGHLRTQTLARKIQLHTYLAYKELLHTVSFNSLIQVTLRIIEVIQISYFSFLPNLTQVWKQNAAIEVHSLSRASGHCVFPPLHASPFLTPLLVRWAEFEGAGGRARTPASPN